MSALDFFVKLKKKTRQFDKNFVKLTSVHWVKYNFSNLAPLNRRNIRFFQNKKFVKWRPVDPWKGFSRHT